MSTKLLMRWNVRPETESEYFEFLVHEFIPGMNKLGVADIQVWYTAYGDCEQKLASGITQSAERMQRILNSQEWHTMVDRLTDFVDGYSHKIVPATRGFQI
jgi:hypothetical protein